MTKNNFMGKIIMIFFRFQKYPTVYVENMKGTLREINS